MDVPPEHGLQRGNKLSQNDDKLSRLNPRSSATCIATANPDNPFP